MPIPIASSPKKSHHLYKREIRLMLFSNSEHQKLAAKKRNLLLIGFQRRQFLFGN
jgi:hypothetical protein